MSPYGTNTWATGCNGYRFSVKGRHVCLNRDGLANGVRLFTASLLFIHDGQERFLSMCGHGWFFLSLKNKPDSGTDGVT